MGTDSNGEGAGPNRKLFWVSPPARGGPTLRPVAGRMDPASKAEQIRKLLERKQRQNGELRQQLGPWIRDGRIEVRLSQGQQDGGGGTLLLEMTAEIAEEIRLQLGCRIAPIPD